MKESAFQRKITQRLTQYVLAKKPLYYFVKEAGSIRGIADIVMCANGYFMVWEVKKSKIEAMLSSGRIVLQRYMLGKVRDAHGRGYFVYPENLEDRFKELDNILALKLRLMPLDDE